jgi:hypothetical protein
MNLIFNDIVAKLARQLVLVNDHGPFGSLQRSQRNPDDQDTLERAMSAAISRSEATKQPRSPVVRNRLSVSHQRHDRLDTPPRCGLWIAARYRKRISGTPI